MGDAGGSADPDGGVAPPAAFFGLWPKFAAEEAGQASGVNVVPMPQPAGKRD